MTFTASNTASVDRYSESLEVNLRRGSVWIQPWAVKALREFFENERAETPEPKPWHDAMEGEVWLITYNGAEYPAIFQADMFRDHGGSWDAQSITAARRIWPDQS